MVADNAQVPPLVPLAAAFAAGIALGHATGVGVGLATALLAIAAAGRAWVRQGILARAAWALAAGTLCGALRIAVALRPAGQDVVGAHTARGGVDVVARVHAAERDERGATLSLAAERAGGRETHGQLRLRVIEGWLPVLPGDLIAFRARLRVPRGYRNQGVPDRSIEPRARGLRAMASVSTPAAVRVLAPGAAGPRRAAAALRQRLARRLDAHTRDDARALIGALVLGERALVSDAVEDVFRRSGTTHLLSVSGVHMAAVTLLLYTGLRRLLARIPILPLAISLRSAAAAITIPACASYAVLTGAALPVLRSAIMAALILGAVCTGRFPDGASALAAAALLLLGLDPGGLFSPSFQLSFAACAGLLLAPRVAGRGVAKAIARLTLSTLAASLATVGLCAYHYGEIALVGVATNVVAIPYSTFVLLPAALLGLGVPELLPAVCVLAEVLIEMARLGADLPLASVRVPTPTLAELALLGAMTVLLLRGRVRWALAVAAVLAIAALCRHHLAQVRDSARVTVLDVGQGDAILVELPGWTLLCDGGGGFDGSPAVGELAVLPALRALGVRRLDAVAISHPHPDHFGGLRAVLRQIEVSEIWTNGEPCLHAACADLFDLAAQRGVPVRRPRTIEAGRARIEPLYPLPAHDPDLGTNDNSVVLRVSAHGRRMLLTGDLEGEGEILMGASAGSAARADVLKVPHHGSRTSSTDELLDMVRPRLAIVSAGASNRFGFPHREVLERYLRRGIHVLRTDRHGAVTVRLGPTTLDVTTVDP